MILIYSSCQEKVWPGQNKFSESNIRDTYIVVLSQPQCEYFSQAVTGRVGTG